MMQFNPMYINVSDNTANVSLGNSPKLKNNKYLFADIIKVLMGNIENGSTEQVTTDLTGENIKVSETKLIDIHKKEVPVNSVPTLFSVLSVLPDSLHEKVEKSFTDLSAGQLVSSESNVKISTKEIKELLGRNLNIKSVKKELLKGKEMLVNIESETEQLNLNIIAEKTNKSTEYFSNVSLIKNKEIIVNTVSEMFDRKPVRSDIVNTIKTPVNAVSGKGNAETSGKLNTKPTASSKNEIVIKTFIGDKLTKNIHDKSLEKEDTVKILLHTTGKTKAKVYEINKRSGINLVSKLNSDLNGKLNFNEINKIEIHKTSNKDLSLLADFTKPEKTTVDFTVVPEKSEETEIKRNVVNHEGSKKTFVKGNAGNQIESKKPVTGKELFEQEYFLVKDKTVKKQPNEIKSHFNKNVLQVEEENDVVKSNRSEQPLTEKDVIINNKETGSLKNADEKQVLKPQLKIKVARIKQSVKVDEKIQPKEIKNTDRSQKGIKTGDSDSQINEAKQHSEPGSGKVRVDAKDMVKGDERIIQPQEKVKHPEKGVLNKTAEIKQVLNESKTVVEKDNSEKAGIQLPEQAKRNENKIAKPVSEHEVQVETKKQVPGDEEEISKTEYSIDKENKNSKKINEQKPEYKNLKHTEKKSVNRPSDNAEIKNEPIKVRHENKHTPVAKVEFETQEKQGKTTKDNADEPVHKVESNSKVVSSKEEKSEHREYTNSNNQNNNDVKIKETLKHHNSKTGFEQVMDKAELHKPESSQPQQRPENVLKSVKYTELFKEVSRFIQKNEKSFMVLELEPKHLGKVNITLDSSSHSIKAHIQVDNLQAKQLLENNLDELFSNLSKNGIQLGSLDISLNDANKQHNENMMSKNKSGNFNPEDFDNEVNGTSNMKYYGYNTYEYLA